MKKIITILLLSSTLFLSACVAVMAVGAAAGLVVYDKRSVHMIEYDTRLFHDVHTAIVTDKAFDDSRIVVSSFNRVILLTGQTPTPSLRSKADKIARSIKGVRRVYDQIAIDDPISMSQRTKDSWITSQVKTKMLAKKGLSSGSIKVVTEDGVVYLIGKVSHDQANLAVDVARHVADVRKVVKIFQYTD